MCSAQSQCGGAAAYCNTSTGVCDNSGTGTTACIYGEDCTTGLCVGGFCYSCEATTPTSNGTCANSNMPNSNFTGTCDAGTLGCTYAYPACTTGTVTSTCAIGQNCGSGSTCENVACTDSSTCPNGGECNAVGTSGSYCAPCMTSAALCGTGKMCAAAAITGSTVMAGQCYTTDCTSSSVAGYCEVNNNMTKTCNATAMLCVDATCTDYAGCFSGLCTSGTCAACTLAADCNTGW